MIDKNKKVPVRSRSHGKVVYKLREGMERTWNNPGDILYITIEELLELTTVRGGRTVLDNHLIIEDDAALKFLYEDEELPPEYNYKVEEVDYLLQAGTNEQFFDALDYAPTGVLELIKARAVINKPDTTAKVDAINEKFGIDLLRMIANAEGEEHQEEEVEDAPKRRSAPVVFSEKKTTAPKYDVVSRK